MFLVTEKKPLLHKPSNQVSRKVASEGHTISRLLPHQIYDPLPSIFQSSLFCPCGGGCPRCKSDGVAKDIGNIQPKLTVSQYDDPLEREADRVAEKIMDLSDNSLELSGKEPNKTQRKAIQLSRKALNNKEKLEFSDGLGNQIKNAINSGGDPIDAPTRQFMESRFGYDFSRVRIHNGTGSHQLTNTFDALAFTYGNNIFLSSEVSESNKKLLAHELNHVIQQNSMPENLLFIQRKTKLEDSAPAQRILSIEASTGQYGEFVKLRREPPLFGLQLGRKTTAADYQALLKRNTRSDDYKDYFQSFATNVQELIKIFEHETATLGKETLGQYRTTLDDHEKRYKNNLEIIDLSESLQILNNLKEEPKVESPTIKTQSLEPIIFDEEILAGLTPENFVDILPLTRDESGTLVMHRRPKSFIVKLGEVETQYGVSDDGRYIISVPLPSGEISFLPSPVPNPFLRTLREFKEAGFLTKELARDEIMRIHPILKEDNSLSDYSTEFSIRQNIAKHITSRRGYVSELLSELQNDNTSIYKFETLIGASYKELDVSPQFSSHAIPRHILYLLIQDHINNRETRGSLLDALKIIFYIAAGILSAFFPVIGFIALGISTIDSTYQVYKDYKEFEMGKAAYNLGFTSVEPVEPTMSNFAISTGGDIILTFIPGGKTAKSAKGLAKSRPKIPPPSAMEKLSQKSAAFEAKQGRRTALNVTKQSVTAKPPAPSPPVTAKPPAPSPPVTAKPPAPSPPVAPTRAEAAKLRQQQLQAEQQRLQQEYQQGEQKYRQVAQQQQAPHGRARGTEPVSVESRARGYASEDERLGVMKQRGWDPLPNYYPGIDGVRGGNVTNSIVNDKVIKVISGADVVSLKNTNITIPKDLKAKILIDLDKIRPNSFFNPNSADKVRIVGMKSKTLQLTFEQGYLYKVDNKEVFKTLREMERTASKQGVIFEWYVTAENGQVFKGWDYFKAVKKEIGSIE